jgi:hypothetical protein
MRQFRGAEAATPEAMPEVQQALLRAVLPECQRVVRPEQTRAVPREAQPAVMPEVQQALQRAVPPEWKRADQLGHQRAGQLGHQRADHPGHQRADHPEHQREPTLSDGSMRPAFDGRFPHDCVRSTPATTRPRPCQVH